MKKLILLSILLIVGMMFAQDSNIDSTLYFYKSGDKLHFGYNSPKKTSLNVNEFVAIYYDDGSMSTYDNTETTCSISFGVNLEKNRKTFNMTRIVGTSTIYIFAGGIILSLVLLV